MSGAFRELKRAMRRDLHTEMQVPATYYATSASLPQPCTVRVWARGEHLVGPDGVAHRLGAAMMAEPEDRIRFLLSEFQAPLRNKAIVSVEPCEAYRIDYLYPADDVWQTARVIRLSDAEIRAADLSSPA